MTEDGGGLDYVQHSGLMLILEMVLIWMKILILGDLNCMRIRLMMNQLVEDLRQLGMMMNQFLRILGQLFSITIRLDFKNP